VVIPEDYSGPPDIEQYKRLLSRALYVLLEPFLKSRQQLTDLLDAERQTELAEHLAGTKLLLRQTAT
jgi:hypothetical protein